MNIGSINVQLTTIIKLYCNPNIKSYILKFTDVNSIFEYKIENFDKEDISNLKFFISDLKNNKSSIFNKDNLIIFKYVEDFDFITLENNCTYKIKLCHAIISTLQEIVEHFGKN